MEYGTGDIIELVYKHPNGIGERYSGDKNRIEADVLRITGKYNKKDKTHLNENNKSFTLEPFKPFDEAELEPRAYIFGALLLRKKLGVLVAPPGVGKSTFSLMMAVSIATNKDLLDIPVQDHGAVAVINNEDDMNEMYKRLCGILKANSINHEDLNGKLFLQSGENQSFIIAGRKSKHDELSPRHKEDLIKHLIEHKISVLIVDPFLETHEGNENDNRDINVIAKMYREVAQRANCAVLIIHHTRKQQGHSSSGHAGNLDSGRGASSLVGAARTVFTLYTMDEKEAEDFGIPADKKHYYVRLDEAKANLSLKSDEPKWYKRESILLLNGDSVGVLVPTSNLKSTKASKNRSYEAELVAAVLYHEAFEEILDKGSVGRETFIKAMEKANVFLGIKVRGCPR